jgi:hypothetical protein
LLVGKQYSSSGARPFSRPPTRGVCCDRRIALTAPGGHPRRINGLADTARFRADDADELVLAALACLTCLYSNIVEWRLETDDGYDPSVRCRCPRCEQTWCVYVTPQQALRLGLMFARAA